MSNKLRVISLSIVIMVVVASTAVFGAINVVTTTTDLADIAKAVGGNKVSVKALANGKQDPHMVEPRPSMVNSLRKADLLVRVGMDLDPWVQGLIDASRNREIIYGAKGYVDASTGVKKLEIPTKKLDPSMGHIHIYGNPHYWLDPENGKVIAHNILRGLTKVSPKDEDYFEKNYKAFASKIDSKIKTWKKHMAPHKGEPVVTYHKSLIYILNRFGLKEFGNVEPKPGIPPSPSHAYSLIKRMKKNNVKVIMMETFYPRKFPDMIARETGAKVVVIQTSVGATKDADSYIEMIDTIVDKLSAALK